MVKGGKVSSKRKIKTRVPSKYQGSDDSDEDYVISGEENEVSEDLEEDYCSSLDGDASEESFGSFVDEEEEEEDEVKKVRKKTRSRAKRDADGFIVDEEEEEEEDEEEVKPVRKGIRSKVQNGFSGRQKNGVKPSRKRRKITYREVEDQDYNDEDDDDDEEFTPDEDEFSDVEEKPVVKKKKADGKVGKRCLKKKGRPVRGVKRRKSLASKKPLRKKGRTSQASRRKARSDDDIESDSDFMDSIVPVRVTNEKKTVRKRRRMSILSDSDFVSSGASDYDYTISEEEREQVREAKELCERLETNLRSSSVPASIQEDTPVQQPRNPPRRKGKEKIEQVKVEVVKQVCGICLSEEDKRRVRGTLDCCTHYFCFACIMEWGKVESRCPLCKQRFKTISKPARCTTGIDLREVVIQVSERDQVYQPTEEELRSYLDPYENVICTECHEGGEDGLMLLCDLCDSPAHTFCVGLGREVPEGNWYCEGCRPVAMGSSSSQAQGRLSDQRTTNNILSNRPSPTVHFDEGIDLNVVSSPRPQFTQGLPPRFPVGGFQAPSPVSGAGAPTLSGRRLIQRYIQQLLNSNRTSYMASINERNSSDNLSNDFSHSQAAQTREMTVQHTRTDEMEASYHTFFEERLQNNPLALVPDNLSTDFLNTSASTPQRRQAIEDPTTTSADRSQNGALWPVLTGMNSVPNSGQFHHFSGRPNISGSDAGVSPNTATEQGVFQLAKEQLKVMVRNHLDNLSRDIDLDKDTFKDIARRSMHTILAACGREHRSCEVVPVPPPSTCAHIELTVGGMTSLMRGHCPSCFESFVGEVVKRIFDTKLPQWLSLRL
ncbi:uncharacterized protein LOC126618944 [Malus sylvestris]|uniref:uncharacterized protein LOC126618944 n=1 Tax=Malus sylvestris TaxID=3752 RepID=UPI0021AC3E88|nr:uncharacterized protein LOC126618944 [Malus sylvestris]XP_050143134.1 uncharacterized protein LOC126618944 [Malus sylvestris]